MGDISRQDVQSIVEVLKNTLLQKMVTRQEAQVMNDQSRERLTTLLQQQAQLIKQLNYQSIQMFRRTVALETRMANLEHELKAVQQLALHMAENMPRQIVMPQQAETPQPAAPAYQQYVYNPS